MHHFIYPHKDTFVSNRTLLENKNFGIDEILQIGSTNTVIRTLSQTKDFVYINSEFHNQGVSLFTGIFTGSLKGNTIFSIGTLIGNNLLFSSSYFSGFIDGNSTIISGSVSGSSINGYISGSINSISYIGTFNGQLTGSSTCINGTGSGVDIINQQNWVSTDIKYVDRSFLYFDLNFISKSISNGNINTIPKFSLKLKISDEYDLPIEYTIYALPISQSWNMGNGYLVDGGSDTGTSWNFKDNNDGNSWYTTSVSTPRPAIDFISNPSLASSSFGYGGGTFYTSSWCSQSFNYESSDINMDITPIVMSWLSGSYPNNGLMLIHSDELQSTGSGFILKFFSKDTNTIYSPYLDMMWDNVTSTFNTGSIFTSSINISTINSGITGSVQSGSYVILPNGVSGSFSSSAYFNLTVSNSGEWNSLFTMWDLIDWKWDSENSNLLNTDYWIVNGFVNGIGYSGTIDGIPVYGQVSASMTVSSSIITGSCGSSFSAQLIDGIFINGPFSGSNFIAYYSDYKILNGLITGSRVESSIIGATLTIPIPSGIDPYAYANVNGIFISGNALGIYQLYNLNSASFNGQFIDGNLKGSLLHAELSGSTYSSSYSYTSSVELTSSILHPLNSELPFSVVLQNVHPTYKTGDIINIGVFGRKQYPLKNFVKSTQQEQYIIPEFIPTSSYYALKDNETDEIVLNFDNYTQISCAYPSGNYFTVDTTGLPSNRYYRILIKIINETEIFTIDTGKVFKIIR